MGIWSKQQGIVLSARRLNDRYLKQMEDNFVENMKNDGIFSPSSLGGVAGVVAFVEWVVGMVLFVPGGGEVGVALIPGFWCGVGGGRVPRQFISGSSFAAKGLRANEHRLSHDLEAML